MGYAVSQSITIDKTKCGTLNTANFPVLISSTIAGLKTVANGGNVQSGTGLDIAFFSDATLLTKLDHEVESWDAATGAIIAWVRIPTLTVAVNTVIYLAYGDASVVTSQQNVPGVWEASYHGVWHFGTGGVNYSTSMRADSTSNGNNLSNGASFQNATTGIVGDALSMGNGLGTPDNASVRLTAAFTVEAWGKPNDFSNYRTMLSKASSTVRNYHIYANLTDGKPVVTFTQGASNFKVVTGAAALSTVAWNYVAATYDGTTLRLFTNGAADGTLAAAGTADTNAIACECGTMNATLPWVGPLDECRISSVARSASYFTATYNSISSPSTFYTLGAGGTPPPPTSTTQRFTLAML
jgi:hypothetical protein